MVITADAFQPQQLLPNLYQCSFQLTHRCGITACNDGGLVRGGQCLAIEFAVRGQRERVNHDKGAGQHILGQMLRKFLTQVSRHQFNAGLGPEIGDQTGIPRHVFTGDNDTFLYP